MVLIKTIIFCHKKVLSIRLNLNMFDDKQERDMRNFQYAILTLLVFLSINMVLSQVDFNYSHSITGTGTIVTDYKIESHQNSEASGKVRATGEMMNRYTFQSTNDSRNITMKDEFTFSKAKPVISLLVGFPQMPIVPGWFRVVGQAWAEKLQVPAYRG